MKLNKLTHIISLLTCLLIIAAVAINRDQRIAGYELAPKQTKEPQANDTIRVLDDGTTVINTTALGKEIIGYGGPVPLEVHIKDGKVAEVITLTNSETPSFFDKAKKLLPNWTGKTVEEASKVQVDAVSGATFSSNAVIGNMHAALQYAGSHKQNEEPEEASYFSMKNIAGLIVVLMAATLPLFWRNRRYRMLQLCLNIVVLGLWCGTFISYTSIVKFMANGISLNTALIPAIMLITAFVYPLFGKTNYYCNNICPFGSLQELAGKCNKSHKLHIPGSVNKMLVRLREVLWAVLTLVMLCGVGFEWMDYELFSAFLIISASWIVIALAVVFILLSVFVPHPYCRFVCPTGSLFKISQNSK